MSEFQIKVRPEPYRTRAGGKVYVKEIYRGGRYPFYCSDGCSRSVNGEAWGIKDRDFDIIGDWEDPTAPVASPDRMEVWLRFACAAMSGMLANPGDEGSGSYINNCSPEGCAVAMAHYADAGLAEYELRKGGGK